MSSAKEQKRLTEGEQGDYNRSMETMLFYLPEDQDRLKEKEKKARAWVWALAGLTLALCLLFCCLTNTANAGRMEIATLITSCVGGWLVIYGRTFGVQEARHEREHAAYLIGADQTAVRGKLTVTKERLRIRGSIRIRILQLEDGKAIRRLKVNETKVRALRPYDGKAVTLILAGGYVAGIGGDDAGT